MPECPSGEQPQPPSSPSPSAAEVALVHLATGARIDLPDQRAAVYIGRPNDRYPPDIDVSDLPDSCYISRVHAIILRLADGSYAIEDAGSTNGTFLNGRRLWPGMRFRQLLNPGDVIGLGLRRSCRLRFLAQMVDPAFG